MEESFSCDTERVSHQFDRFCQKILKGEIANYYREIKNRKKHEVSFSDLPEKELENFVVLDEYETDNYLFRVLGYDIEVRDALIAEALGSLSERKREIILLSFEIARALHLVQSTVHAHKKRSLELLRKLMERKSDEERD